MTDPLHADELSVDPGLVRALVDRAVPEWSSLSLTRLRASGSSNTLFRLGDDLLVRLPRQPGGGAAIDKEARWLPLVGPMLPVSVPEVVVLGDPDLRYPERWSVVRWLDGDVPATDGAASGAAQALAEDLGAVITSLHDVDVPASALVDPELRHYRGSPLRSMDDTTRHNLAACRAITGLDLDLDAALRVWEEAMALPEPDPDAPPRWYHGDLLGENLLARDGHLASLLDFGGLAVGDPTVDLMVAWDVLDPAAREVLRHALGADDESWLRGRAWALAVALMTFPYYWRTMPHRCASRLAMARAVLADAPAHGSGQGGR